MKGRFRPPASAAELRRMQLQEWVREFPELLPVFEGHGIDPGAAATSTVDEVETGRRDGSAGDEGTDVGGDTDGFLADALAAIAWREGAAQ